jgi:hypothetical protein
MTNIFDIDDLVTIISEYIGELCKTFLEYLGKNEKLNYLYTRYIIGVNSKILIKHLKIRYLEFDGNPSDGILRFLEERNTNQLNLFSNLLTLKFDEFNQEIKKLPNSLLSLIFGNAFWFMF